MRVTVEYINLVLYVLVLYAGTAYNRINSLTQYTYEYSVTLMNNENLRVQYTSV